jgi:hypothetical protein
MRTRLIVVAAVLVAAAAAFVSTAADPKPADQPRPPAERPTYSGVVEQVKVYPSKAPAGRPVVWVLVRGRLPLPKGVQPTMPLVDAEGRASKVWAVLHDATLEQRGGHLEAGAAVTVWARGETDSDPPQATATYIVCEPAPK